MANGTETRKSIIIAGELADKVQAAAEREHRSFSNMVEFILQLYFEDDSVQESPSVEGNGTVNRKSKSA